MLEDLKVLDKEHIKFGTVIPTVYVIRHKKSGKMYVGSSANAYLRMIHHCTTLERLCHQNKGFQEAFNDDPNLTYTCYVVDSREHAYDIEQALIDYYMPQGLLFNKAPNSRKFSAPPEVTEEWREHLSRIASFKRSDETKKKMSEARQKSTAGAPKRKVSVNGIIYPSVRGCARALKMHMSTVQRNVNNPAAQWKDWFYA